MKSSLLISLMFSCFYSSIIYSNIPEGYEGFSAEKKREVLWKQIIGSDYDTINKDLPKSSFGLSEIGKLLLPSFLNVTFETYSDELPTYILHGKKVRRIKAIHQTGTTAKVRYIPAEGHPYTGIFRKESVGLARISLAVPNSFNPGMGLKLFKDNGPSVNIAVMKSLTANSEECNPFFANFSNDIPETSGFLRFVAFAFERVAKERGGRATYLSLNHLAEEGHGKGIAPYKIVLKPSIYANSFNFHCDVDYREIMRGMAPGTDLYHVYAAEKKDSELQYVGKLVLDSSFIPSEYGDKVLFFQHRIEN